MQHDLIIGAILAVLVVLVFLRDWRATIVSAFALPTSVIGTFAVMHALGFTFNTVTMLALTLSIGLLIDDAIVVIENIVRHLEKGERPREAALNGTGRIALAVLAVTLSVIAVFIPVAFMKGMVGRFFFQFGVTVAVAVAHLLLRLDDAHADDVGAHPSRHGARRSRVGAALERFFTGIERGYRARPGVGARAPRPHSRGRRRRARRDRVLGRFLQFTFIPSQDQGER